MTSRTFSSVYADLRIIGGLHFRTRFNADVTTLRNGKSERAGAEDTNVEVYIKPSKDYTWTNILSFDKDFEIHHLGITAVHEQLAGNSERYRISGINPSIDNSLWYALDGMDEISVSLDPNARDSEAFYYSEGQQLAFLGRINYSLLGKYVLTASLRYDGSSVLADGHKWDYFPSASIAWNAGNEILLKRLILYPH